VPAATDGLIVVDKPTDWTSHDVVARIRRLAQTRKVGHAGTLDPMATGVLVVGVGAGTRLLHYLVLTDKAYTATIRLGQATMTDDAEGEIISSAPAGDVDPPAVENAMAALTGDIDQVPSSVSAVKVDGKRAYQQVRTGQRVDLAARPVSVRTFTAHRFARPSDDLLDVDVSVECSSGTYVRALARDLGAALGVGGHLTALRRTRVGPFTLDTARTLDDLAALDSPVTLALPDAVRAAFAVRAIDEDEARELSFGRSLSARGIPGVHGAIDQRGRAVALLSEADGRSRPVLVFAAAG
jgi:tRNA pseudouridine55 synthase